MYVPILKNRTIEMSVLSQLAEIGVFNSTSVLPLVELIQEKTRSNNKNTILDDLAELLNVNSSMTLMIDFLKSTKLNSTTKKLCHIINSSSRFLYRRNVQIKLLFSKSDSCHFLFE